MDKTPKVSVITPFLNAEKFLSEAVESVLSQTYTSWELLLIDDGSSDASTRIAKNFAAKHAERIRYLEHSNHMNKGMPASRNLGILHSKGEYIAHLDSDDIWSNSLLEDQIAILDHYPTSAMVFGPMRVWFQWPGTQTTRQDYFQRFTFRPDQMLYPPAFVPLLLSGRNDPAGYLIRRNVLEKVGLYEDCLEMCEDWALYVKIAMRYEVFVLGKSNYSYRQHASQSCSELRRSGQFHSRFIPFLKWLEAYIASIQCNDPQISRAVRNLVRRNQFNRIKESVLHVGRKVLTLPV